AEASYCRRLVAGPCWTGAYPESAEFPRIEPRRLEHLPGPTEPAPIVAEPFRAEGFPLVYEELRLVAHRHLARESEGHTLSTTALVHEVYLRLSNQPGDAFNDRTHFFAMAARAMRRILVDHARRNHAEK